MFDSGAYRVLGVLSSHPWHSVQDLTSLTPKSPSDPWSCLKWSGGPSVQGMLGSMVFGSAASQRWDSGGGGLRLGLPGEANSFNTFLLPPRRDFHARRARAQRRRCGKAPAGRASSSPGGIGTWGEEAPPPPNDPSHIPKLPAPGASGCHLGCGRKSFSRDFCRKEDRFFPFRRRRSAPNLIPFRCVQGAWRGWLCRKF